ncbi:globin [Actinoplanes sp. CA-030573]|uniref:globin n=1 Tax=Actinoplanes sp. CA-030573 TaxID=3239898 RepID=UPI003D8B0B4C
MSSGSSSGSGADPHLLALLRAIRLRQAAPDAVAAGVADAAAALTQGGEGGGRQRRPDELPPGEPAPGGPLPGALPPGERHAALPAGPEGERALMPRPGWAVSPAPEIGVEAAGVEAADPEAADPGAEIEAEIEAAPTTDDARLRRQAAGFFGTGRPADLAPAPPADLAPPAPPTGPLPAAERADRLFRNRFTGLPLRRGPETENTIARPLWASADQPGAETTAPHLPGMRISPPMVASPGRSPSADGMDPADEALLRQTKRLLGTSLVHAGGPEHVAERFHAALLQADPELPAALPGDASVRTGRLADGLVWLVEHLDDPPALVGGCAQLGAALAECGVAPERLRLVGAALAEAIRAGTPAGEWGEELDLAWRSTWQHAYEWIRHGATTADREPVTWAATVVSHELRRPDLAVVRLRPYLPMPFRPGQYARIEVRELPGIWRPYSLAGAPRRDDVIELHVRAKTHSGVSGTLVYRTRAGDQVRLSRAEGEMGLPESPDRNVLMIAGDTGVAPLKALLRELADTGDPRSAVLFWGVRNLAELYDIEEIAEIARSAKRATVVPVVSEGDPGPYASGLVTDAVAAYGEWSRHEVYLAGPPLMLAATSAALHQLGVAPEHIHHDAPE